VIVQRVAWPRIGGRRPPSDTSELDAYQCAVGLVEAGFEAINNIAAAIQLDRPEPSVDDDATLAAKRSFQEQETNAERRRRVLLMG
jgi:hypothetical protein